MADATLPDGWGRGRGSGARIPCRSDPTNNHTPTRTQPEQDMTAAGRDLVLSRLVPPRAAPSRLFPSHLHLPHSAPPRPAPSPIARRARGSLIESGTARDVATQSDNRRSPPRPWEPLTSATAVVQSATQWTGRGSQSAAVGAE